jgi:Xaa-Pro aminopeptidase
MSATEVRPRRVAPISRSEYEERVERLRAIMGEHGFDGMVLSDYVIGQPMMAWIPNSSYVRYLSGFHIPGSPGSLNPIMVVPREGEPTLVVPPGIRAGFAHVARATSWVPNIISGYDENGPASGPASRWGLLNAQGEDVARALRESGLAQGRVGVAGSWAGYDRTVAALPGLAFEPTCTTGANGLPQDLLTPLMRGSSPAAIERLEATHAAADAAVNRYLEVALTGATYREAIAEGKAAGLRAGADEVVLFGTVSAEPWAFWDLRMADPDAHFEDGKLYFVEVAHAPVEGFSIETARSFVPGTPNERQRLVMTAVRESIEAMEQTLAVGRTGAEMWQAGIEPVERVGLEAWGQIGHNEGWKPWPRVTNFLPGSTEQFEVGQVLVLHACIFDPVSRIGGMGGDSVVLEEDGGWRHLSPSRARYDLP